MGVNLPREIEASGLGAALESIATFLAGPMDEALERCQREAIAPGIANNFTAATDFTGNSWPPHAPLTVKIYGPHPLLILSGLMKASASSAGAENNVYEISGGGREMKWGTDVIYAATHQYGDSSRNIPQREFIYISDSVAEQCCDILVKFIDDSITVV